MKAVSLFSGVGGFELGMTRAGIDIVLQAEMDERCRSVLQREWPNVRKVRDVRDVGAGHAELRSVLGDGAADQEPARWAGAARTDRAGGDGGGARRDSERPRDGAAGIGRQARSGLSGGIDLIFGGFPCQDVSVAGKRGGLDAARSGLWFEFHRIVRELRPRWVVIENVEGLLTSNDGWDFAAVLGGLAGWIPVPPNGGFRSSGGIEGLPGFYDVAYAVLDAQHFSVPQRRGRVFVVASPRGRRAGEQVLALCDSCGGGVAEGLEAWEAVAGGARGGADGAGARGVHVGGADGAAEPAGGRGGRDRGGVPADVPGAVAVDARNGVIDDTAIPLQSGNGDGRGFSLNAAPLVLDIPGHVIASTLEAAHHGRSSPRGDGADNLVVQTFAKRHRAIDAADAETWDESAIAPTLNDRDMRDIGAQALVVAPVVARPLGAGGHPPTYDLDNSTYVIQDARTGSSDKKQNGLGVTRGPAYTLTEQDRHAVYVPEIAPTVTAKAAKGTGGPSGDEAQNLVSPMGRVRRLTPLECDRLMGWPDDWSACDAEGKALPDSARYRMTGNGVVATVAEWIARRLVAMDALLEREEATA